MTSRPPFFTAWFAPAPHLRNVPISRFNTSTVRVHATAQLLFLQRFPFKVLWKALTDDSPYRLSGKNQGFAQVRGLQASAWLQQRFSPLIGRSIGAEPKLFLWNSLIKPPRVGDVFKGMVAWDFSVFQKVKLGSVFSKSPTVETPKVNPWSSHRFQVGVGS